MQIYSHFRSSKNMVLIIVTVFFHLYPPLISLLLRGIMLSSICCVYFQSSFCAFIYTYVHKHTNKKVKINDIENKEAIEKMN